MTHLAAPPTPDVPAGAIRIHFLGTGTSTGVPTVGCDCATCRSDDPRDKRLRTSTLVQTAQTAVWMDCGPDFRQQFQAVPVQQMDAVVITHPHADHILGLDETRPLTLRREVPLPIHGDAGSLEAIRRIYPYAFVEPDPKRALPKWQLEAIEGPFTIGELHFTPHALPHYPDHVLGFEIAMAGGPRVVYATDCGDVPDAQAAIFEKADLLVLDMLRLRAHPSHLHLDRALELAGRIAAGNTVFVHMNHEIRHAEIEPQLPENVTLGYDGLTLDIH